MTAREVKDALRRHLNRPVAMGPGPWTCVEEFAGVDLLALSAWTCPAPAARGLRYPRIAYEVKVARSDFHAELMRPSKRYRGVDIADQFYFAVPRGLLTDDELAYEPPEWLDDAASFVPEWCPEACGKPARYYGLRSRRRGHAVGKVRVPTEKVGGRRTLEDGSVEEWTFTGYDYVGCERCGGSAILEKSRAEREAPYLWVPRECGLIEVDGRGVRYAKRAPKLEARELTRTEVNLLARWISVRPDPNHEHLRGPKA